MAGILVMAQVIPGPAVESSFFDAGDVIRHQIVAQAVALVGGNPQIARGIIHGHDRAVANAGRELAGWLAAFGVRHQNVSAVAFGTPGGATAIFRFPKTYLIGSFLFHVFRDVGAGADRNKHALAVLGKSHVAGGMSARWFPSAAA